MIKNVFLFALMLGMACGLNAQPCGLSDHYSQGKKVTMETKKYETQLTDKFWKLKDEKKEAKLAEIDEELSAGKITPTITTLDYNIEEVSLADGNEQVTLDYTVPGYSIKPTYICKNDTLYILRHTGPVVSKVDGKVYSILLQGPQRIPLDLKVGDELLPFDDYLMLPPSSLNYTVPVREITVTQTHMYLKTMTKEVRMQSKSQMFIRHYVNARVTGQDKITVMGQEYDAFIIESQNWMKMNLDKSFEAETEHLAKYAAKLMEKTDKKISRRLSRVGVQNDEGYTVTAVKEWYVPGLGIVRTQTHNIYGELEYDYAIKSII